jgi:uncharacterized membrane protein required for colicin V production
MLDMLKGIVGFFFDHLRGLLAGIVGRVMVTLGIGLASYTAILPHVVEFVQNYVYSLDASTQALLGALHFDVFLTMIFSALATKMGTKVKPIRVGGTDAQS